MRISDLEVWRTFAAVAEKGGFSKAAKVLRSPVPQVSRRVAKLEEELGVRLFHRTTRVVKLTDEGRALLPKVSRVLQDLGEIESSFERDQGLAGTVRMTCVPFIARRLLLPCLADFMDHHPETRIELELTTQMMNLVENGIDLAIRIDSPLDSDLIYRKLAPNEIVLCAAPSYLKKNKAPVKKAADLAKHDLLFMDLHGECEFQKSGLLLNSFSERRRIHCESGEFLTELALQGKGILVRSIWDVRDYLKDGSLVQLLANDSLGSFGHINAVIPSRRFLAPRVRALFDRIVDASTKWTWKA